jgi:hypothetical protein
MFDPISISVAISAGTKAFGMLQKGIAAGRELQDMASQLGEWGKAVSDVAYVASKVEDPNIFQILFGNVEQNAIEVFAAKKQQEFQRSELKKLISYSWGQSGWQEFLSIEAKIRKQQQETIYRKAEIKEAIIVWTLGTLIVLTGFAGAATVFWFVGHNQGKW